MDFWQTVQVVFRRWYITFPAFLAALGVAGLVYGSVPTQYVSTSVLLLTTPTTGPTEQIGAKARSQRDHEPIAEFRSGPERICLDPDPDSRYALRRPHRSGFRRKAAPPTRSPTAARTRNCWCQAHSSSSRAPAATPQQAQDIVRRVSALAAQELAERQKKLDAPASTYISCERSCAADHAGGYVKPRSSGPPGQQACSGCSPVWQQVSRSRASLRAKSHRRSNGPTGPFGPNATPIGTTHYS